ncbi:hypothetical protein ACQ4PT_058360 [Festuca glaucescens]
MAPQPAAALPQDVLAEVLRRLAPLVLAASRRVCRAWRDTVDARLRRHLLSRSVHGIFINFTGHDFSEFFSRPSTGPAICGGLDFLPSKGVKVTDHCNGLLLCGDLERDYVVNPATRRWARLPPRPLPHMPGFSQSAYLAFDPAVSPHYEVFLIPRLPGSDKSDDKALLESEWPPALYVLHVFSSTADQWGEKTFLREGEAAGIVGDMDFDPWFHNYRKRFGVDPTQQIGKPWILQDVNNRKIMEEYHNGRYRPPVEEKYDWNSDEDNFLYIEDVEGGYYRRSSHFLGFHPYKEIVYFELHRGRGVAYDWNSSKFQDLGCSEPTDNHYFEEGTTVSFPYTPCWMAEFPGNEFESLLEDEEIARKKSELEAQLEDHSNFSCSDEYELRKFSGSAKRVKDCVTKLRRRRRITAR